MKYIYSLNSKMKWSMLYPYWNKLKLVSCKGVFFQEWCITERLGSSRILSLYLWFLTEKLVLQIRWSVYGHKFHLKSLDDIVKKRKF